MSQVRGDDTHTHTHTHTHTGKHGHNTVQRMHGDSRVSGERGVTDVHTDTHARARVGTHTHTHKHTRTHAQRGRVTVVQRLYTYLPVVCCVQI